MKSEHKLVVRPNIDIKNDKIFMELEVPEGFRELLKQFAVTSGRGAEYCGCPRYLVKSIIANSSEWKEAYHIFFIKDLIKNGKCSVPVDSMSRINDLKSQFNEIKNLVKLMMTALVTEETTYVVTVEKEVAEELKVEVREEEEQE